jgi:hypothetical protein
VYTYRFGPIGIYPQLHSFLTTSSYWAGAVISDDEPTVLTWATALLKWRRVIVVTGLVGGLAGLAAGLLSTRVYTSSATFIPQASSEGPTSGLALAASQFGIRVPSMGGGWGPTIYVEILRSHTLQAPIVLDTFAVAEEGGRRAALADLLEVDESDPGLRAEYGVRALAKVVDVTESKPLGAVRVTATTKWPSVSLVLVQRLVQGVNDFNLKTRKSQAAAERQFVERQAADARDSLRAAESKLLEFLQRNRVATAPTQTFEKERLQRDVSLRDQVYTTLLQNYEEAKMREVRDTPVITLIEAPRLAALGQSRQTIQKSLLGGIGAGMLAVLFAFVAEGARGLRRRSTPESQEFFKLVDEAMPAFVKRDRP